MHNRVIRRISENVKGGRHIVAAPLCGAVSLRYLVGDEVPEDRKLVREPVIDANDFFLHVGRIVVAADELVAACGLRKDSGRQERRCVRADQA